MAISQRLIAAAVLALSLHTGANSNCATTDTDFKKLCDSMLDASLLSTEKRIAYQQFLMGWEHKLNLKQEKMDAFVDYMKQLYLKLLPLTVGKEECTVAFVEQPISAREFQHILLNCFAQLELWLDNAWEQPGCDLFILSNGDLTTIARRALPASLIGSFFSRLGGLTRAAALYQAMAVSLHDLCPALASAYVSFELRYKQEQYAPHSTLALKLEKVLARCQEAKKEFTQKNNPAANRIINILTAKLLSIKDQLSFAQQIALIAKTKAPLLTLFIKHCLMLQDPLFLQLANQLDHNDYSAVDRYITVVQHCFSNADQKPSEQLLSDIVVTIEKLRCIKEKYDSGLVRRWWSGKNVITSTLDTMITVLDALKNSTDSSDSTAQSGSDDLFSYILSGKWLSGSSIKKISKDTHGDLLVEFIDQALGNKHFGDLKTAATFVLLCASPFLLTKVISFILPSLSKDLKQQLTQLLGENQQADANSGEKLLAFANSNPDLFKQICNTKPEIIDLLATSLKQLAGKPLS